MEKYNSDGSIFTRYVATYNRAPQTQRKALVYLAIEMGHRVEQYSELTVAVLDTGTPCSICSPQWARVLGYTAENADADNDDPIRIRGRIIEGRTYLMRIRILPDDGAAPIFTIHAFVPNREQDMGEGTMPALRLGLAGCLTSIPLGLDGNRREFYWL